MKKIIIIIAAVSVLCSCGAKKTETAKDSTDVQEKVTKVTTIVATKKTVVRESSYSASVEAFAINNIAPQSVGRIIALKTEVGSFVSKGQVLANMEDIQLQQAQIKYANNLSEYNRLKALLEEGGVSQSDFDQIEMALKLDKSNVDNLEANTNLRSPISGVVSARNYDVGDMFTMGKPIYTVEQITPVKLLVGVSEADYTKVKVGQSVQVTSDALPDQSFTGKVVRIHPTMDAKSHTFNAEVHVANQSCKLRPGMYSNVTISFGTSQSIVIPDAAVVKQQGSGVRSVFVMNADNTVSSKQVELGLHMGGEYEIVKGIEDGDKVVVKGATVLRDGQTVEEK